MFQKRWFQKEETTNLVKSRDSDIIIFDNKNKIQYNIDTNEQIKMKDSQKYIQKSQLHFQMLSFYENSI